MMLTEQQAEQIGRAVSRVESATSSEIAVCILDSAGDARGASAIAGAFAFAAIAFAAIAFAGRYFLGGFSEPFLIGISAAAGVLIYWLSERYDLALRTLPAGLLIKDARRAARATFLDHALDATPERNAVLLFVSRAERYVEILPDRGLDAAVPAQRWANIVTTFQARAAKQGLVEAVTEAVDAIGAICAGPFPAGARNPDLVPNRPIVK